MVCFSGEHSGEGREEMARTSKKLLFFLGAYVLDREGDYTPWEQLIEVR